MADDGKEMMRREDVLEAQSAWKTDWIRIEIERRIADYDERIARSVWHQELGARKAELLGLLEFINKEREDGQA